MAESLISSVLRQLITISIQNAVQQVKLVTGVGDDVRKVKMNFEAIQDVLEDAEEKQLVEKNVKRWLDQLKDVSYDMEDVVDEWNTALLKLRLQADAIESASNPKRMVCPFISCFSFGHHVVKRHDIATDVRKINQKLDEIARQKDTYKLIRREIRKLPRRLESTSIMDESKLQGRDQIKEKIVCKLLHENSDLDSGIPTITLIGMGGIGKTALAKMVFNDAEVQAHFKKKVWTCVSDFFDPSKIARDILEGLEPNSNFQSVSLNSLLGKIREVIGKEKVFLVLDDVWEDNYARWEELKDTFCHCMPDSRILVTTRKESVGRVMESSHVFHLEQLSDQVCWEILRRIAYLGRDRSDKDFEKIGKEIASKCKGLPLAAKTLGSLLQEKESTGEWRSVLNSEIWKLKLVEEDVFSPLLLSYYDLPSAIRRCLLYCAIFPKDYQMSKEELILHWKVQGYLNFDEDAKKQEDFDEDFEMELKGKGYLDYLAGRCFFQDFRKDRHGGIYKCKMHDLVHDFVQFLTEGEVVAEDVNSSAPVSLDLSSRRARHLRINIGEEKRFPVSIKGVEKMRSLLAIGSTLDISCEKLRGLFSQAKSLRLLELGFRYSTKAGFVNEIPEDIGKLVHLRYLSIRFSAQIRKLPEAICELLNLQYLDLRTCLNLRELPDEIEKLINLKYLYTISCKSLTYYPKGIGKLTGLRRLDQIIARIDPSDNKVFSVGDLENLDLLSGDFRLHMEGNLMDEEEVKRAKLHNKTHLTKLELTWFRRGLNSGQEMKDKLVQLLNPPPNAPTMWM